MPARRYGCLRALAVCPDLLPIRNGIHPAALVPLDLSAARGDSDPDLRSRAGRPAGDSVELFRVGATFTMPAPQTAGQYRFRYLLGEGGWITAAMGPVITVQ